MLFKSTQVNTKYQQTRLLESPSFATLKDAESSYGYMLSHLDTKINTQGVHAAFQVHSNSELLGKKYKHHYLNNRLTKIFGFTLLSSH